MSRKSITVLIYHRDDILGPMFIFETYTRCHNLGDHTSKHYAILLI
jgi:hypothetical protein